MSQTLPAVINGRNCYMGTQAPVLALIAFYAAFNDRDLNAMERNWWTEGDDAAMANPLGGIRRGWPAIREVYERIFMGPAKVYVEFYEYTLHETGEMFYAVGRERGYFERDGQGIELAIRTSRVFRKIKGHWYQVHHHGSIEDSALLERYQKAVRGEQGGESETAKRLVSFEISICTAHKPCWPEKEPRGLITATTRCWGPQTTVSK